MSLRQQVIQGGLFLAIRQGLGMAIGVVGVLLLTRLIGPANYGIYAAALGIFAYLQSLALWGINVYLIRHEHDDSEDTYHSAFSLLCALGIGAAIVALCATPLLSKWVRLPGFGVVASPMFALLPIVLIGQVGLARLERHLDYRRVALVELAGQLIYYLVSLSFAFSGQLRFAPVAGWIVQQLICAVAYVALSNYRPKWLWNRALVRDMLTYGFGFSSSLWVWQLRSLVNPLLVSRIAGAEAVGIIALAIRLVEYLTFVKSATWRMSLAALGRMRGDVERMRRAVGEGMRLQILALGPILLLFAVAGPTVIPLAFGPRWNLAMTVYPYVALSYLINGMFNLHSSALYVMRRNWDVTAFHLIHVALFGISAAVLVSRFGLNGYGYAEVIALSSYLAIHLFLKARIGAPTYGISLVWALAFGVGLFASTFSLWMLLAPALVCLMPATWEAIASIAAQFRQRDVLSVS